MAQEAPRLPATLSLVAAGLGVSVVPASMHRLGGEDIVYRPLGESPPLTAPLHLALRHGMLPAAVVRFRAMVREMVAAAAEAPNAPNAPNARGT